MTVRDSAPFRDMAFQAMIEGDACQRQVRFGKTKFRLVDNFLNLPGENARLRQVGFPTSYPSPDPRLPQTRVVFDPEAQTRRGNPCHLNAMARDRARSLSILMEGLGQRAASSVLYYNRRADFHFNGLGVVPPSQRVGPRLVCFSETGIGSQMGHVGEHGLIVA